ncbi:hypothetical protein BpHYR1_032593 [Brachionus plicatilis]|uniref:Uncharacterized protein n=1 Tax=Brachionus plicatilis TaxID=10195 RepID=A0A3M7QZ21_BRAPC|nr:hypothetical protein BpHYR1_032593 [Brachionus plicatilis]
MNCFQTKFKKYQFTQPNFITKIYFFFDQRKKGHIEMIPKQKMFFVTGSTLTSINFHLNNIFLEKYPKCENVISWIKYNLIKDLKELQIFKGLVSFRTLIFIDYKLFSYSKIDLSVDGLFFSELNLKMLLVVQ